MCPNVTFQICALLDLYSIDGEEVGRLIHVLLGSKRLEGTSAKPCKHFLFELPLQENTNVLLKSELMQKRQALTFFKHTNVFISQILLHFASMFGICVRVKRNSGKCPPSDLTVTVVYTNRGRPVWRQKELECK